MQSRSHVILWLASSGCVCVCVFTDVGVFSPVLRHCSSKSEQQLRYVLHRLSHLQLGGSASFSSKQRPLQDPEKSDHIHTERHTQTDAINTHEWKNTDGWRQTDLWSVEEWLPPLLRTDRPETHTPHTRPALAHTPPEEHTHTHTHTERECYTVNKVTELHSSFIAIFHNIETQIIHFLIWF